MDSKRIEQGLQRLYERLTPDEQKLLEKDILAFAERNRQLDQEAARIAERIAQIDAEEAAIKEQFEAKRVELDKRKAQLLQLEKAAPLTIFGVAARLRELNEYAKQSFNFGAQSTVECDAQDALNNDLTPYGLYVAWSGETTNEYCLFVSAEISPGKD